MPKFQPPSQKSFIRLGTGLNNIPHFSTQPQTSIITIDICVETYLTVQTCDIEAVYMCDKSSSIFAVGCDFKFEFW